MGILLVHTLFSFFLWTQGTLLYGNGEVTVGNRVPLVSCPEHSQEGRNQSVCVEVDQFMRGHSLNHQLSYERAEDILFPPTLSVSSESPEMIIYAKPLMKSPVYSCINKLTEAILNRNVTWFQMNLNELKELLNQPLQFVSSFVPPYPIVFHVAQMEGFYLPHIAVRAGGSYALYFMNQLNYYGANWNILGPNGVTCLAIAVRSRNLRAVEWLLPRTSATHGAQMGKRKETVIFVAVRHFQKNILLRLIQANISTVTLNTERATALHIATQMGNVKAVQVLLDSNVNHMQRDIYGKISVDYAVDTASYYLVELLVNDKAYIKHALQHQLNGGDFSAVRRIARLMGYISIKTFKRLIEAETRRLNMAICERSVNGNTLIWEISRYLLSLPAPMKTEANRQIFSQILHILLNFYTFVRVARHPLYKVCNPHTVGYFGPRTQIENIAYGRIPLDFLLTPTNLLHNDTVLISRFYVAMDPANENSLVARLARHNVNVYSLQNVLNNKPQQISMKVFLLGRSGHLDGCGVAASRQLWVAVRTCANVLTMCLNLENKGRVAFNQRIRTRSHIAWTINEPTFEKYTELRGTCDVSLQRMILRSLHSEQVGVLQEILFNDIKYASPILSDSPLRENRHLQRNLYLIKLFLAKNETFTVSDKGVSPIENLIFSYQSDRYAMGSLSDSRYFNAMVNRPYITLSRPEDIEKALELLGHATVYGFIRNLKETHRSSTCLLQKKGSWHYMLDLLRHATIRRNSNLLLRYDCGSPKHEKKNLSQPALVLADHLWNMPYVDAADAKWTLPLLGGTYPHRVMQISAEMNRPSDYILDVLYKRRQLIVRILSLSPSIRYDPDLRAIHHQALRIMCFLYVLRLFSYGVKFFIVCKGMCGEALARQVISYTVDFWEIVYPAHRGLQAIFFSFKCAFLGRLGSRHHPRNFVTMFFQTLHFTVSVFTVVLLYALTLWTGDWVFLRFILFPQVLVALHAWFCTRYITNRTTMILLANLCPCTLDNLQEAVFLTKEQLLDWRYSRSAGISTEQEFDAVVSLEVSCMRQARKRLYAQLRQRRITNVKQPFHVDSPCYAYSTCAHRDAALYHQILGYDEEIWNRTSDEYMGDVFQISKELAGYPCGRFLHTVASRILEPLPYAPTSATHPYDTWRDATSQRGKTPPTGNHSLEPLLSRLQARSLQSIGVTSCTHQKNMSQSLYSKRDPGNNRHHLPWACHATGDRHAARVGAFYRRLKLKNKIMSSAMNDSYEIRAINARLAYTRQKEEQCMATLKTLGFQETAVDVRAHEWQAVSVTPPEFLHDKDNNVYLRAVRAPLRDTTGVSQENDIGKHYGLQSILEDLGENRLIQSTDMIRIHQEREILFNDGVIDMGHLRFHELVTLSTQINTLDFIALFYRYPHLRRLSTQVFFASLAKYQDYVFIVWVLETITFLCAISVLVLSLYSPREYQIGLSILYRNAFQYLIVKKIPHLAVLIIVCQCYAYQRLMAELARSAALHMLLARQTYHIGQCFTWKVLQPYLAINGSIMMNDIWNIRRVACRRLDNIIELTNHQFNVVVFGFLAAFPILLFVMMSEVVPEYDLMVLFAIYGVLTALAIAIVMATIFGFQGYKALCQFATLSECIHRIVDPIRCRNHPIIFLADKNKIDPTMTIRCLTILGFRFTTNVVTFVLVVLGSAVLLLGATLFYSAFPRYNLTDLRS